MDRLTPKGPRSWELGNDIMHQLCDKMSDLAKECERSHPAVSAYLVKLSLELGITANDLMEPSSGLRMASEPIDMASRRPPPE